MSLEKIPWYYKIFSFQNNHTLIIYVIMSSITSSLMKIQFLYISSSWIWAQITAGKYYLQLSFLISFQLEVFYFNFFGMNKTKIYVCSGYVPVLTVNQNGSKKVRFFFFKKKSQQFNFKSINYFLHFRHGIHLIQCLFAVRAPTLEQIVLDLGLKRKEGHEKFGIWNHPHSLSVFLSWTVFEELGGAALNLVNTFGWFVLSVLTLSLISINLTDVHKIG